MSTNLSLLAQATVDQDSITTDGQSRRKKRKDALTTAKEEIKELEEAISWYREDVEDLAEIRDHYLKMIKSHLEDKKSTIQLFCRLRKTSVIEVNPEKHTVYDLKMLMSEKMGCSMYAMYLISAGVALEDERLLNSYPIRNEASIEVCYRIHLLKAKK